MIHGGVTARRSGHVAQRAWKATALFCLLLGALTLPALLWAFPCPTNPSIECRSCPAGICMASAICIPSGCLACGTGTRACGDRCCPSDQTCIDNGSVGSCGCPGVQCSSHAGTTCCTAESTCCGSCCCAPGTVCLPPSPGADPCQCGKPNKKPSVTDKYFYKALRLLYEQFAERVENYCGLLVGNNKKLCLSRVAALRAQADRYHMLEDDPADPNFTVVAEPVTPVLPGQPFPAGRGETAQQVDALNALLANQEQQIGLVDALLTSINRAQGAFDAGNAAGIDLQNQAIVTYAGQLVDLLLAEPALRVAVQRAYLLAGVQVGFTPAKIAKWQATVGTDGLPADLSDALAQLGVDSAGQAFIFQNILSADPAAVAARGFPDAFTDPSLDAAVAAAAAALAGFAGVAPPPTTTSTTLPPDHQLINGLSLTLVEAKDPSRQGLSVTSKDPTIAIDTNGRNDDPTVSGGSLRVRSSVFDDTYALPSIGWRLIGKPGQNKGYQFKSKTGPIGSVTVMAGKLLKASGKGDLGTQLGVDPRPVDIVLHAGSRTYCAQFGGPDSGSVVFKNGKTFAAKNAAPPLRCPP